MFLSCSSRIISISSFITELEHHIYNNRVQERINVNCLMMPSYMKRLPCQAPGPTLCNRDLVWSNMCDGTDIQIRLFIYANVCCTYLMRGLVCLLYVCI